MNNNIIEKPCTFELGNYATVENIRSLLHPESTIKLTPQVIERVDKARKVVEYCVHNKLECYGVTTGVGNLAHVSITPEQASQMQVNLIRSHAIGVGKNLSPQFTRIHTLCHGHSGISLENLNRLIEAFNSNFLPCIPEKGTVGASGDLAPLAHLTLGLMGEGKAYDENGKIECASKVLQNKKLRPLSLGPKEGLALINGTQFMTALGMIALIRAKQVRSIADLAAALTLEALYGCKQAFSSEIHKAKGHEGQIKCAEKIAKLIHSKKEDFFDESNCPEPKVQDGYSLRCIPQIHGISGEIIDFCEKILTTEINGATDNPLIFLGKNPYENESLKECGGYFISGGNFHGEYPAKALDILAIGVHEFSNLSERRIERMNNNGLNKFLPSFLIKDGGLNCGFMIHQYTAAALVSENKVLTHPSSVDSIPTSEGQEDHVSMGGMSARKCLTVIENVENVLAIEIVMACQAIDLSLKNLLEKKKNEGKTGSISQLASTELMNVYKWVREVKKVPFIENDMYLSEQIESIQKSFENGEFTEFMKI